MFALFRVCSAVYVELSEILSVLVVGDQLIKDLLAKDLLAKEISAIYVVPLADLPLSVFHFHYHTCPPTPLCVRWWDHVV